MEFVLLFLVFALVSTVTLAGFFWMRRSKEHVAARLQSSTGSDPSLGSSPDLVLGEMTPALAAQVPMGAEDKTELQKELRSAGYYRPTALMEYAAVRTVLIVMPLLGGMLLALVFAESVREAAFFWIGGLILAVLGFSLPRVYLYVKGRTRAHAIDQGLPVAIDMLSLCLTAGLNVFASLERVVKELHLSYPVLAFELEIVRRQAELRSLEFALAQFADRVGLPHVRNLAVILSQSENLGTDAVSTLTEYSDSLRFNMRQRAEEMANKAPLKLLIPAYMLVFGAGLLLLSPILLEFMAFNDRNEIGATLSDSKRFLEEDRARRANPNTGATPAPPNR
jgi:tight adherence protein C